MVAANARRSVSRVAFGIGPTAIGLAAAGGAAWYFARAIHQQLCQYGPTALNPISLFACRSWTAPDATVALIVLAPVLLLMALAVGLLVVAARELQDREQSDPTSEATRNPEGAGRGG